MKTLGEDKPGKAGIWDDNGDNSEIKERTVSGMVCFLGVTKAINGLQAQ